MEQEVLQQMVAENREWETQLTKRNEQYLFDLRKALQAANLSEEDQVVVFHEILSELIPAQKKGQTARQLFGTVSEKTTSILTKPVQQKKSKPWEMWLDDSLLMFSIFSLAIGVMGLFSKKPSPYGIISLVVIAASGGYVFYLLYKNVNQYNLPGADRSKKPSMLKTFGILALAFLGWFLIMTFVVMIPPTINIPLPPIVAVIIGAAAFGVRYWLRKKYGFSGSLAAR